MRKSAIFPAEGTHAYRLLELIAISGELPIGQAKRLIGFGRYYEKVITALKSGGLITAYSKNTLYGYRLTLAAKTRLIAKNPGRFSYYLSGNTATNHVRGEYKQRLRLYCVAETYTTMLNSGVSVNLDEKPPVFFPEEDERPGIPYITAPSFYSSREIKDMGIDAPGIRGSRAAGILLTPGELYITYNAINNVIKLDYKSEMRLKAVTRTAICGDRLGHQYTPENIRGLVFGGNMDFARKLLCESQGGKRNYFIFDGGYDHFHYLPNDVHGETVLKILCTPALCELLHRLLSVGLLPAEAESVFEHDATDAGGRPVLFAFDCDLPRIGRFNRALLTHGGSGTLICFDFQADALHRFCADSVMFQTIDFTKFCGRYLP